MPKGGARSRSGPPPDPNALRRDRDQGEWTTLDADGREGDPPEWPLSGQKDREAELWTEVWAYPQAVMWERDHHDHAVALYVRSLVDLEGDDPPATLLAQVRQYGAELGLTPSGLARNRWKIGRAPLRSVQSPTPSPSNPSRARLQAVADDAEKGERTA
jgi:hypothetical protein